MALVHARLVLAVGALVLVGTTALAAQSASAAAPARPYDFNGDGFADLAVGVPHEDGGSDHDSGAVNVIYGSRTGLTASGDQLWSQDSRGVPGSAEPGDRFGTTASGDFDGDGFADLAIGAPGETLGGLAEVGAVTVLYGSRHGLRSSRSRFFSQATRGVPGTPVADDQFGAALVAGDFNGDHRADLAIGTPRDTLGPDPQDRGSVTVLLGSRSGLRTKGAQKWDHGPIVPNGVGGAGYGLDAGDTNADGRDELAIVASGVVAILPGAPGGLTATGAEVWNDDTLGIGTVLPRRGTIISMALGDLNGDGRADLAVGSNGADRSNNSEDDCSMFLCQGAVAVLPGSADPSQLVTTAGRQILATDVVGLAGTIDFGRSLATGDLDGDGRDELCAGSGSVVSPEAVVVVHFEARTGIKADASRSWEQATGQVSGSFEPADAFAETMQVGQYGRSSQADLAIGVLGETVRGVSGAGRVAVLYGSSDGVTATGQQSWSQASPGIRGSAETDDGFGTLGR
jgi:hypothetical protein